MLEIWLPLLICAVLGGFWYHVLRLRERAVAHARQLCERHNLQLLDDSVSLHRLRVRWKHGTLHVMREYRFYTSAGGSDRRTASLVLLGDRVVSDSVVGYEHVGTPVPEPMSRPASTMRPTPGSDETGNVVPFTRTRRTLH